MSLGKYRNPTILLGGKYYSETPLSDYAARKLAANPTYGRNLAMLLGVLIRVLNIVQDGRVGVRCSLSSRLTPTYISS